MESLRIFLNSLDREAQEAFAERCGTSVGYIRKVLSTGQRFGESLAIAFERESSGVVTCENTRPDVDWAFLRGTATISSSESAR